MQLQISKFTYGGTYHSNVRQATSQLRSVSGKAQKAVNEEIQKRICNVYSDGKNHISITERVATKCSICQLLQWAQKGVGYHSDELTCLGSHPVIASLSLGVEREF
ncbi:hypothetical protein N7510_010474 [Penicillium lagena]|uniref:uncharacterized protein n=1 Tax=Penicillium lagena TaxID=94218 RepID=UPI00254181A0|nr:uncharacterized protein N7510_010474 [Penicillium lagena]KAJ5605320.1 hypothetical protein N7510_010474 [Penicillium lagena]